jgi:molecular chaperone HtpG
MSMSDNTLQKGILPTSDVASNDMVSNVVIKPEEFAYGFIIEVLTSGLYPDVFHVIREYVQNSFDAIIAWRQMVRDPTVGSIQIRVESPSIFIFDDGTGMHRKKMREYRYVGYSGKSAGESVGFRGIGKLSGISVAEKLIVTTSPHGTAERYKLVFDAKTMLEHILQLKQLGQNIPLSDLIQKYTTIDTENEDIDQHYTLVELHNIRQKSKKLMDQEDLSAYLALNAPVDFSPDFKHGSVVDGWLRTYVNDYETAPITVNGTRIYKYYLSDAKPPQQAFVWSDEDNTASTRYAPSIESNNDEGDSSTSKLLAFSWYCEHKGKGQFEDQVRQGLLYRVKNFAVGDNQLTRITLWKTTPARAFYFFGEIHVCDSEVVPSSERGNFEENKARERLYRCGRNTISRTLNQIAGKSSDERRAKDFIEEAEKLIFTTETGLITGIPRETRLMKILALHNAVDRVEDRINKAPIEHKQRGLQVIDKGRELIQELDTMKPKQGKRQGFYDIKEVLKVSNEAARMYDIIVDVLIDQFGDQPDLYESLLKRIHKALEERWSQ